MDPRIYTDGRASGPRLRRIPASEPLHATYRVELRRRAAPVDAPRLWFHLQARTVAAARHLARAAFPAWVVVSITEVPRTT